MSTKQLGVAVIGLGIGEQHARTYAADPRCRLEWLIDLDPAKAQALAAELGGRPGTDVAQVFADTHVDVVSIASYDQAHYGQVIAGLRAGKRLFVEKPLCLTLDELADIVAQWQAAGSPPLESNLVLRSAPLWRKLREMVAQGVFGRIYAIDADYLWGRLGKLLEGWRGSAGDYSITAGGSVHMIDLILWLTGQRPARVHATGNAICTQGYDVARADYIASTYVFDDGMVARVTGNSGCVHRHQHVMRIFGTDATFIYDDQGPRLYKERDPGGPALWLDEAPLPPGKGALIPGFIDDVLAGRSAGRQNFDVMTICAATDAALMQGKEMEIRYV